MRFPNACLSGLLAAGLALVQDASARTPPGSTAGIAEVPVPQRLVVATFDEQGVPAGMGDVVADMLTRAVDAAGYQLLERRQVRRVLEEQAFSASDLTQPGEAVRYGRLADTRFVLVGTVYRIDGTYIVSARMVDSASGIVHESARAFVQFRTVDEMSARIAELAVALGLRRPVAPPSGAQVSAGETPAASAPPLASAPVPTGGEIEQPTVRDLLEQVGDPGGDRVRMASTAPARTVRIGEDIRFTVRSDRAGFLSIFVVDAEGRVGMLLPNPRMPSMPVSAGQSIAVPGDFPFALKARPPIGPTRIKAIVGEHPIELAGSGAEDALRRLELGQRLEGDAPSAPGRRSGWTGAELEFLVVDASPAERRPASIPPPASAPSAGSMPAPAPKAPASDGASGRVPDADAASALEHSLRRLDASVEGLSPRDHALLRWPLRSPFESSCDLRWEPAEAGAAGVPSIAVIDADFDPDDPFLERAFAGVPQHDRDRMRAEIRRNGPAAFRHGNRVASIIGGQASWLPAVVPGAPIVPIRITTTIDAPDYRADRGGYRELLGALRAALDARCRVVNLSLSVPLSQEDLRAFATDPVWDELERAGVVIVCAAGNRREDLDAEPLYPACLDRPNILCVGAVGPDGRIADWGERGSARGRRCVDVLAPGSMIAVSDGGGRAGLADGTSYACAFASGAVARLLADEPSMGAAEAVSRIVSSAEPSPGLSALSRAGLLRWPRPGR